MTILGTDDFISPYDGLVFGGIQYYLSADNMHQYWVNQNNTESSPIITTLPNTNTSDGSTVERHIWADGDACVQVEHLKVIGGGHDWPGTFGNMDINASEEIWNYVSAYDLNGLIECESSSNDELGNREERITAFPNPVKDMATIKLNDFQYQTYQIYSIAGEQLFSDAITSEKTTIDLSNLPTSIYFVTIGDQVLKLMKVE